MNLSWERLMSPDGGFEGEPSTREPHHTQRWWRDAFSTGSCWSSLLANGGLGRELQSGRLFAQGATQRMA